MNPRSLFIVIISACYLSAFAQSDFNSKTKFIADFIKNEPESTIICLRLCGTKHEIIKFLRLQTSHQVQLLDNWQHFNVTLNHHIAHNIWFIIDVTCPNGFGFVETIDGKYLAAPYRWLLLDLSSKHVDAIADLPLRLDTHLLVAHSDSDAMDHYRLTQYYRIDKSWPTKIMHFGRWSLQAGLIDERNSSILSRARKDLNGREMKVPTVITHNDTLQHLHDFMDIRHDAISKASYLVVHCISEAMNATVKVLPEKYWGHVDPSTKQPVGVWGQLATGNGDMGGTSMFMTSDRLPTLDYPSLITVASARFVFRSPPLSYTSNIYYLPFAGLVWLASIVLVIFCVIVIYVAYRVNAKREKDKVEGILQFMVEGIGVVCQMGAVLNPKGSSGRIAILFFCIAMVFLYTSYTANIVALLQSTSKSINTLEDLLNSNMEMASDDVPFSRHWLPITEGETRRAIYRKKIAPPNEPPRFFNFSYGMERMRQGLFAFHVETALAYQAVQETFEEYEKCSLKDIDFLNQINPWLAIQKNSPYKEVIKVNAFKVREHGLQQRLNAKIYKKRPVCDGAQQNFDSVRLIDCYAAILILVFGFMAAVLIFFMEKLYIRHKKSRIG